MTQGSDIVHWVENSAELAIGGDIWSLCGTKVQAVHGGSPKRLMA